MECLAQQPSFRHPIDAVMMDLHRRAPPPDVRSLVPDLPRALAKVVAPALEKEPSDHRQSAAEMRVALAEAITR